MGTWARAYACETVAHLRRQPPPFYNNLITFFLFLPTLKTIPRQPPSTPLRLHHRAYIHQPPVHSLKIGRNLRPQGYYIYKIDRHNIRLPSNRGARALFHDLELFNRMKHELNTESRHPFLPFKIWVETFNRKIQIQIYYFEIS